MGAVQWSGASESAERLTAAMAGDHERAVHRWAESGGLKLTGRTAGPALDGPARVALAFDDWARQVCELSAVVVDGASLIGERAAIAGLTRQGAVSAGGGCRLLRCADGHVALSLVRDDDVNAIDAWLGESVGLDRSLPVNDDGWSRVGAAVATRLGAELIERAVLLGLPCSQLGERSPDAELFTVTRAEAMATRSLIGARVVDLSSLWAGPLCARVLGLAGAHVTKVESVERPDGARRGPAAFYELMHSGHDEVQLDLRTVDGRAALRSLLRNADVVIEASRPRALVAMGLSFADLHDDGWRGVWLSITGHGADGDQATRVAFGDDAAVAGGLVAHDEFGPVFCADAIADPATGLLAATVVLRSVADGVSGHVGLSLAHTAAHLAART